MATSQQATAAAVAPHMQGGSPAVPQGVSIQQMMEQMQQMAEEIAKLKGQAPGAEPPDTSEKTYYHRNAGSNIVIMRRGPNGENIPETLFFNAVGELTTSDPVVHAFLKPILNAPGSPISLLEKKTDDPLLKQAAKEVQEAAARSIEKMGAEAPKQ